MTNRQTFLDLQDWIKELKDKTQTDTIIHVVGSKSDLKSSSSVEALECVPILSHVALQMTRPTLSRPVPCTPVVLTSLLIWASLSLSYARRQIRSWLHPEPPPTPAGPPSRPTMPTPSSSRFGFSVSSRPQPLPPATSPSIIAPSAGEFFPSTTPFTRTASSTTATRERRQSGDWAGSIASADLDGSRPGHERRQSSRRRSEEWARSTAASEERRVASQAALEAEEEVRINGLQVEDGVDGIRLWECSALKNRGKSYL